MFAIGIADAQTSSPISLSWNAPPGCSDSAEILKHVADLRGGTTTAERMSAVANVTLDQTSGIWSLQITTNFADGTHGERQIQAESCKAAADATASILALALTARATEMAASSSPPTATATTTSDIDASAPVADASVPAQDADAGPTSGGDDLVRQPLGPTPPAERNPLHLYIAGFFGGTVGDLPSIGLGGGGAFGVSYRFVRAELYGDDYAFGRTRFADNGAANFQVFSAGARTCLSFGDSFSVGPCAAFELGSMAGQSFNVTTPSSGTALVVNGFLGALGTVPLDKNRRFALRALLEIGASFEQPQFVLDGVGFVHQPAPVLGRGTIGAELHF
jgi:hypothetical protein